MSAPEFEQELAPEVGSNVTQLRQPPHNPAAEVEVIGQSMLSKTVLGEVLEMGLLASDFYRPAHEAIWSSICRLDTEGEPVSAVSVAEDLQRTGQFAKVGGYGYLHTLISAPGGVGNGTYYAGIVREKATFRRLIEAGVRITQLGYGGGGDRKAAGEVQDVVSAAEAELFAVSGEQVTESYVLAGDIVDGTFEEIEAAGSRGASLVGIPTGFADLDRLTGGLHPGQLVVIAGRPAMGKSTAAVDVLRSAAIHHGLASVMFSLEMGRNELMMRILSAEAQVQLQRIRKGALSAQEWASLSDERIKLDAAPLFIDDSPNLTMSTIRTRARRLKQRHDLKLVVVDYLQLMTSGKRVESRQLEVSEFSRALKLLAKELQVPVIALSQLNRGPEQRTDKKPAMSDLRESGAIENDADLVILLHREDAYEKEGPRAGEADFIVAKHRNGPTDTITVAFQGHYSRFVDMAT